MKGMMKPRITSKTDWEAPKFSHSWRNWRSLPPTDEATGGGMEDVSGASQFFLWPPFPPRDERPYPFPRFEEEEDDAGAEEEAASAAAGRERCVEETRAVGGRWKKRRGALAGGGGRDASSSLASASISWADSSTSSLGLPK